MEKYGNHGEDGARLNVLKLCTCLKNEYVVFDIKTTFIIKIYGIVAT